MTKRVAFLIGNQTFLSESGLPPLKGPENDVAALANLLCDQERGDFEVHKFLDKPSYEILPNIERALGSAAKGDLFLIYYSGHGKQDRSGRLCLATANTHQDALRATSIPARHLTEIVEESDCDVAVLLLDCCYSGAVDDGLRGDVNSELHVVEDAHGFYIMTASTGLQAARETELMPGGEVMGRFTAALVDGIQSGAADLNRRGKILLSDLRRYLEQAVTGQRPQFFDRRASGDPLISLSPATAVPSLDAATVDKIREVLAACYRQAVFARMHAQTDPPAMFASLSECRVTLQRLVVFVEPTEIQSLVASIIGELRSIETVERSNWRRIDSAKQRIIATLFKLRDAAGVSFVLPTSLTEEAFSTVEEASKEPHYPGNMH